MLFGSARILISVFIFNLVGLLEDVLELFKLFV